jgi:hypothetical protein
VATAFALGLLFPTIAVLATAGVAETRAVPGSAAVALTSGYRLSYWIAASVAGSALAIVLLLLRGTRTASE